MRPLLVSRSRLVAGVAAAWILAAGLAAGQIPFAEALNKALDGPRAADAKFAASGAAIAAHLTAQKPRDLEQAVRQANLAASGIQPTQAGVAWMTALGSLLAEQ